MADKVANFKELWKLVQTFNVSRAPSGMRNEHKVLSELVKHYRMYEVSPPDPDFLKKLEDWHVDWFNRQNIPLIKSKFGAKVDEPTTIKGKHATYTKDFPGSYKKFQDSVAHLESFLGTLAGPQATAAKDLKIIFTTKLTSTIKGLTVVGQYQKKTDLLMLDPTKLNNSGSIYMSANYVVLHELGHRYLNKHPQDWDINAEKWATTPYSRQPAPPYNEEKFAELFAMAKWPTTFNKYITTLKEFVKQIK